MRNCFSRFAAVLVLCVIVCGCEKQKPPVQVSKTIAEKLASTEQRVGFDFFDSKNSIRSRATTVYYLIADDGTMIEVDLKSYAKFRVGQKVSSHKWK